MSHTTTPAEIATIRATLDLNTDIRIEVTRDGWENANCEITGAPAAVDIRYVTIEDGQTSITVAADQITDQITVIELSTAVDHTEPITLDVSYWWLRYAATVPAAA